MQRETILYKQLASCVDAVIRCQATNNTEWEAKHTETIEKLVYNFMPSGSGIDSGAQLDLDRSTPDKLVFVAPYHHMNDGGMYDGWSDHDVIVRPSLAFGITLKISGSNRQDVKEYLRQEFEDALSQVIVWNDGEHDFWQVQP